MTPAFLSHPALSLSGLSFASVGAPRRSQTVAPILDRDTREPLINTAQAAALLAMSPRSLEGYRRKGGGPTFVTLSRNVVRYRGSDLDAWIRSRAAPHTATSRTLLS